MRIRYKQVGMDFLCGLFGKTRQAYYKSSKQAEKEQTRHGEILAYVRQQREEQPKIGTYKLQHMLRKEKQLEVGRDALYKLLRANNLLIRRRKKYRPATTNGDGSSIYPDLRKELEADRINQLWSSDITYFGLIEGAAKHCYATFVIDEYSHLIVGFTVAKTMTAVDTLEALQMAVRQQSPTEEQALIFHTDRGSQFKSTIFQNYLNLHGIQSSMTQDGKPSDNPVSERLNGIIKDELLDRDTFDTYEQAVQLIAAAVRIYNTRRPHLSCELMTPQEAHQKGSGPLKKLWRQRKTFQSPAKMANET